MQPFRADYDAIEVQRPAAVPAALTVTFFDLTFRYPSAEQKEVLRGACGIIRPGADQVFPLNDGTFAQSPYRILSRHCLNCVLFSYPPSIPMLLWPALPGAKLAAPADARDHGPAQVR